MEALNRQYHETHSQLDLTGGENRELKKKLEEYQNTVLKTSSDNENKKQLIANLLREKEQILTQLNQQEDLGRVLKKENDDMKGKLGHNSKVRSLVEEQFSSEITALHQHNSELKVSLNASNLAKAEMQKKLETVQNLFNQADARLDQQNEVFKRMESDVSSLQRQCEMLRIEKNNAESELNDKLTTIVRLENEIQRLKRGDFAGRRVLISFTIFRQPKAMNIYKPRLISLQP